MVFSYADNGKTYLNNNGVTMVIDSDLLTQIHNNHNTFILKDLSYYGSNLNRDVIIDNHRMYYLQNKRDINYIDNGEVFSETNY